MEEIQNMIREANRIAAKIEAVYISQEKLRKECKVRKIGDIIRSKLFFRDLGEELCLPMYISIWLDLAGQIRKINPSLIPEEVISFNEMQYNEIVAL